MPAGGQSNREPITKAGRFAHEAAAFDPREGILYLTEDNFGFPSGFYRYIPPAQPDARRAASTTAAGSRCSRSKGQPNAHLAVAARTGPSYQVEWVDIDDPSPRSPTRPACRHPPPTTRPSSTSATRAGPRARPASPVSRAPPYANGEVYFTSTQGGGAAETGPQLTAGTATASGQVWAYGPATKALTCRLPVAGPRDPRPAGQRHARSNRGTLVLCEDSTGDNFVRGLTRDGQLFDIALNRLRQPAPAPAPLRRRVRRGHVQP